MKLESLKKLIKEAVREAVREEVGLILLEQKQQMLKENLTFTTKDVVPVKTRPNNPALANKLADMFGVPQSKPSVDLPEELSSNPFADLIADAAANMTAQDRMGLRNLD